MTSPTSSAQTSITRKIVIDLAIMTVIGIILAVIGPFGSFEESFANRLIGWVGFSYLGYCLYSPMGAVVDRLHTALDLPKAWLWVGACLVATIPMSAAVWSIRYLPNVSAIPMPGAEAALTNYFYVLVIGGGVTLLFNALGNRPYGAEGATSTEQVQTPEQAIDAGADKPGNPELQPRFTDRLPPELGTQLIALEMEDHYVRAHTALGSDLVLLRMRDAVAELGAIEGMQVHRSWWVARGAVTDVKREGRNVRLILDTGLEAPVSRANVVALKEAGWI